MSSSWRTSWTGACRTSTSWTTSRGFSRARSSGWPYGPVCYTQNAMNSPFYKNLALWMVIGLIVIVLFNVFQASQPSRDKLVFSDFLKRVEAGEVREVLIRGKSVTGKLADGNTFRTFTADYPDLIK